MNIIGGMAIPGAVSLSSENFSVVARRNKHGEITHTTRMTSKTEKRLRNVKLMPKTLKLSLFLFLKLSPSERVLLLMIFLGIPIIAATFFSPGQIDGLAKSGHVQWLTMGIRIATISLLGYIVFSARGFHAAEHMAIAAYENHGVRGLYRIAEQDRVHNMCGSRMALPMVIAFGGAQLVLQYTEAAWAMFMPFFLLEIVLWIDALVGYNKISATQSFSLWFQRTITTKPPNEKELQTGRQALEQLLIAEGELEIVTP